MNRFAEAIQQARVDVVPKVMIGTGAQRFDDGNGGGQMGGNNLIEGLLAMMLSEKLGLDVMETPKSDNPEVEKIRKELLSQ
jgi:hypothetical protein